MKRKSSVWLYVCGVILIAVAGAMLWAILNRQWVYDFLRGMGYEPVGEMARIRDDLSLTERGEFLFRASQPVLSSREEFNDKCRAVMDEEMAVLGCYRNDNIYVYDISSAELDGIRELTTAHELLHAVWGRMSEEERDALADELALVLKQNQDVLKSEIDNYDASEQREELFVRAGTEVANLPVELEKVYGEIFEDQDMVVGFYNKYIAVFRAMEQEMDALKAEMEEIQAQIDSLTAEYELRADALDAEIDEFNVCANRAGCFASDGEFYARRNVLVAEQEALEGLYVRVNELVDEYNARVEKYNADVTRTEKLNRAINSASEVEEL